MSMSHLESTRYYFINALHHDTLNAQLVEVGNEILGHVDLLDLARAVIKNRKVGSVVSDISTGI